MVALSKQQVKTSNQQVDGMKNGNFYVFLLCNQLSQKPISTSIKHMIIFTSMAKFLRKMLLV